jgi:hypothetical protein
MIPPQVQVSKQPDEPSLHDGIKCIRNKSDLFLVSFLAVDAYDKASLHSIFLKKEPTMLEKFISRFAESVFLRIVCVGATITPIGITTSWLGASYLNSLTGAPFIETFLGLFIFGVIGTIGSGLIIIYAIERWIIQDKAVNSWKWVAVRFVLFLLSSFPISIGTLISIRIGMQQYPAIIESVYFVEAVTGLFMGSILFTLIEQVIKELRKRENKLKTEIKDLRIEIDQMNRKKQVTEITESDYFQDLQKKVALMREVRNTI